MFEKEERDEIFKICQSNWSTIVADLSGEKVRSIRIDAVAENLGLYAPPVLDSMSVSHVISLSSFDDFDKAAKIGLHTKLVTALVILNVWQDFKSWKSDGKPIDGAAAWVPQRLLLGITGPQLKLPDRKKKAVKDIRPQANEQASVMSSSLEFCEKNWSKIQSTLVGSEFYHYSIRALADHLGLYWPRKGSDFRVVDLIDKFRSAQAILKIRGVGKKKAETIYAVLSEAFRFERGESDRLEALLSNSTSDNVKSHSPIDLLEQKWRHFCVALRNSGLEETTLDQHYRPLGMKCGSSIAEITLREIISAGSLQGFVATRKGLGKKKLKNLVSVLQRLWATVEPNGSAGPPPPSPEDQAKEILQELGECELQSKIGKVLEVAGVKKTTKGILHERYGFGDEPSKTLEVLGSAIGVTRERIRQLQLAGEQKVRDHAVSNAMLRLLEAEERLVIIGQLAKKCRSKLLREKRLRATRNSPAHQFLIEILYSGSVVDFLDEMVDLGLVQKVDLGWWVGEKLEPALLAKFSAAREFLFQRGLPCPIGLVASKFELNWKQAEDLLIALGFRTRLGLAFEKKLSAIQRRSVFAVLVGILEDRHVWNESFFYERAITYSRNKRLSFRLFQRDLSAVEGLIVNSAGPYAILNPVCFELFQKELARDAMGESESSARSVKEPIGPETDITSEGLDVCLWQIFKNERILKFEQVEERFLSTGRVSLGSVGPIMLAHLDIIRYAPGWWGRSGLSLTSEDIDALCNPNDAKLYIEAKHGGGLLEMFRFWTPEMEYRWARWAENDADSDLFESLLAVINPEEWPVPESVQNQWKRKQEQQGYFRLGSPTPDFSNGVSDFSSLYGLIALAVDCGQLGYAGISHFLGWRFMNDRRTFSAIALLVVLGVLKVGEEPDKPHCVTTDAENILRRFSDSLIEKPREISDVWRAFIRSKMSSRDPVEDCGWFSMDEFLSASSRWIGHTSEMEKES